MSLTRTQLGVLAGNNADQTSYTSGNFTYRVGLVYIICIHTLKSASAVAPTTVTAGSLTFTKITSADVAFNTVGSPSSNLSAWVGVPSATVSSTAITIDYNGVTQTGAHWGIQEYAGANRVTPIAGTTVTNTADSTTSVAATHGALASANNHQLACMGSSLNANTDVVSGTNWNNVGTGDNFATPNSAFEMAENTSGSASQCTFSTAGSGNRAIIVMEISADTLSPQPFRRAIRHIKRKRYI